ncbi:hypothetical protein, partial [Microvirga sp. KLBC 81]|uniref:hypothetical protein n=1 Tax=Microvirga sp. KLBC 81 TaxID=1862707 RepID=UPI00197BF79A
GSLGHDVSLFLKRFWQARHPPRYVALLTPSSPTFRNNSMHRYCGVFNDTSVHLRHGVEDHGRFCGRVLRAISGERIQIKLALTLIGL